MWSCIVTSPAPHTACSFPNIIFTIDQYNSFVTFGCIHEVNFVWLKAITLFIIFLWMSSFTSWLLIHPQPLGNRARYSTDDTRRRFTASSLDQDGDYQTLSAASARLNYRGGSGYIGGWKPNAMIMLGFRCSLGGMQSFPGVITQGRDGDGDGSGYKAWVTHTRSCTLRWITPI